MTNFNKEKLRELIREEIQKVLSEVGQSGNWVTGGSFEEHYADEVIKVAQSMGGKLRQKPKYRKTGWGTKISKAEFVFPKRGTITRFHKEVKDKFRPLYQQMIS